MIKLMFKSIGFTINELKYKQFYLFGLVPIGILPLIFLLFFGIANLTNNLISMLISMLIFLLISHFGIYYVEYKFTQQILLRRMNILLKDKKKTELIQLNEIMEMLMQKSNFWKGYLQYLLLFIFFSLVSFMLFGISRLFYYSLLQSVMFILFEIFLIIVFTYLNFAFFNNLRFYETLKQIRLFKFSWIIVFVINFVLCFIIFLLFVLFGYLLPLYLGFFLTIMIIFNINFLLNNQINNIKN